MADPVAGGLRQTFAEQIAALRLRFGDLVPTARWDDLDRDEHDRAFMVAGAVKADLLADLAKAVDKAVAEGTGFDAFKKDFRALVTKHGWHGWTGEGTEKGEAWRMRVIYRTNMRTSYAAGRMAQLVAAKYKFWVYRHGNAAEPRLQHLAWDGVALSPDHPFWVTHYPPNDWGCSCYVNGARTEAGIKRVGGVPGRELPDGWAKADATTGNMVGIGKGWDYAPGATVVETIQQLRSKLDQLPEEPATALIQDWLTENHFGVWLQNPSGNFPLVRLPADAAARIGSEKLVADMSAETAAKQLRKHPELSVMDYTQAQRAVRFATKVIQDTDRTLIFVLEEPGVNGHVLVVKATKSGQGLFVTSFRRITGDPDQRARALRQLERKQE